MAISRYGLLQKAKFRAVNGLAGEKEKNFHIKGQQYARMQVRTIEEILSGKLFDTPDRIGKRQSLQIDLGFQGKHMSKQPPKRICERCREKDITYQHGNAKYCYRCRIRGPLPKHGKKIIR